MPTALRNHQYELCDSAGTSVLLFGTEETGYLTLTRPGFESAEMVVADSQRPMEDSAMFGRDYLGSGGLHTFEMGVLTDDLNGLGGSNPEQANIDAIDKFKGVWRDRRWRQTSKSYAILRRGMPDGTQWRTYGRPRKVDPAEGGMTKEGYTPMLADFAAFEEGWYSDTLYTAQANLRVGTDVGITSPLVAPITTIKESRALDAAFQVLGSRGCWPTITFTGPSLNPSVTLSSLGAKSITWGLTGTVPYGQSIAIETSPWKRRVVRVSDSASRAGMLSGTSPTMQNALLPPGTWLMTYKATDGTQTSYATLAWRHQRNY